LADVGEVGDDADDEIYYMYTPPSAKSLEAAAAAANLSPSNPCFSRLFICQVVNPSYNW